QVWARTTNLNVGLVEDSGDAFGTPGLEQHDLRFGDVRVGAIPMAPDVYAVAVPSDDLAAGTWAGDIIFNSNAEIKNVRAFYQTALHEAGHVFGLGHSDDPNSPMHFGGSSIGITTQDVQNLRAIYGIREIDVNEHEGENNDNFDEATHFEFGTDVKGETPMVAFGDLTLNDLDYFEVNLPSNYSGRLSFRLDTIGLSLADPILSIYNEAGQLLRRVKGNTHQGTELITSLASTQAGRKYYALVSGDSSDGVFSMGTYAIGAIMNDRVQYGWNLVRDLIDSGFYNMEDQSDFQEAIVEPEAFINADAGTNDTFQSAQLLTTTPGFAQDTRYDVQGSISLATDIDFYSVRATPTGVNGQSNMNIRLDSLEQNGLIPAIDVFNATGNRVRSAILVNSNGQLTLQVPSISVGDEYIVKVSNTGEEEAYSTGNYRMTVDFSDTSTSFNRFASGNLTSNGQVVESSLFVAESQMLHINLVSQRNVTVPNAVIWMTIYDEEGNPVFRSATRPGETRSANSVMFSPGSYSVRTEIALPDGVSLSSPLNFLVRGRTLTDSQGPKLLDPTQSPFDKCDANSPDYCYPNDTHSPDPYVFVAAPVPAPPPPPPVTPWVDINNWYWYTDWLTPNVPNI
ncbi:MAG: matrixin family metalloprotease, partial [Pirellulaceae bacterium]